MEILLSALVSGLLLGMVLAIVALGLTIIFGVMDMVNFAHGEYLMVGMYTGLLIAQATGMDPLFTLPAAALVGFLFGLLAITAWPNIFCGARWWPCSWAPSGSCSF